MKKFFDLFLYSFLVLLFLGENIINAQPQPYQYCIYVKQGFSSWCDCSNGDEPVFDWADIQLKSGTSTLVSEIIRSDKLNQKVLLNLNLHNDGVIKSASNLTDLTGNPVTSIYVHTRAGDIVNDNYLEYSFKNTDLKIGENTQTNDASDPCHNVVSSNREGYSMTTNVYVDDPVYIENVSGKSSFILDYEPLSIKISDFLLNGRSEKTILQVALDNELPESQTNWVPVDVGIYPKGTISLTYSTIAGRKDDPASNYYSWMGHGLKFRVIKTLYNGFQTYGSQVTSVKFYPQGLQYSILQTRRTYCNNNVTITAKLDNSADEGFITKIDPACFYWVVAAYVNGQRTGRYKCEMSPVANEPFTYQLVIKDNNGNDPFNEPATVPIEWRMQLIQTDYLDNVACVKSFTIPSKPPAVTVVQKPDKPYTINGTTYHVPDMNHPFAMLNIDDPYAFASLRKPYTILEGSNELLKLEDLPDTYDQMTQAEKNALDAQFESEFIEIVNKTNNPYKTYFDLQLTNWMNLNKNGTPLTLTPATSGHSCMFSNDGSYFLYQDVSDFVYKVSLSTPGSYPVEQKINVYCQGIDLGGITPDNKTLIYIQGACCGGATVWKSSLNTSGINIGTQVTLPFNYNFKGVNCIIKNPDVFFDNNNIIIGQVWGGNGLYKKNITTGTLTTMYTGQAWDPCLSPDNSFLIYRNGYDWYKATINGNSISGITKITTGSYFSMSSDGNYALVCRDNKTYKVALTGTEAGTETEAIVRCINNYNFVVTKNGKCIYQFDGTYPDYSERGFYLSYLNGGIGSKISSVKGSSLSLAPNDKYLIYCNNDDAGKYYKLYLGFDEAASDLYPKNDFASNWYNTFKANYKQLWLYQRVGVKVTKGIRVNETQHLVLKDNDQCSYPFDIYVSAPPQPSFTPSLIHAPSDACAHDGYMTITYNGGGSTPYVHEAGTLNSIGNSIVVTGLSYGDNNIQFFDGSGNISATYNASIGSATVGITSTPATDQTCPTENGSVTINVGNVSGDKYYKLTCDYPYNVYTSPATTSNSYKFSGLKTGTYKAEVTSGTCYFFKENISVVSKIFDITTPISTTDATTLDGTGSVSLTFENRVNNIEISSLPSEFSGTVSVNNKTYTVSPRSYNVIARHTDSNGTCDVSKNFTINKPQFTAAVGLDENDSKLIVRTSLSGVNSLLSPYKIRLLNNEDRSTITESMSNGNLSTNIQTAGNYIISLQYGSGNYEADLCSFSYPLGIINNVSNVTSPTCPGGNGTVTLSPTGGIDGSNFLFSLNGTNFSATKTFTSSGKTFSYDIKDDNTTYNDVSGNVVTINKSLVKHFDIPITEPTKVTAQKVIPVDVTCSGLNNGSVSLVNLSGGSGVYQYKVDDGVWHEPSAIVSGLVPGSHNVYLKDSQNDCLAENIGSINIKEPDSLKTDTMNIIQPICEQSNGSIKVEVKGGRKPYKYDWTFNGSAYFTSDTTSDTITNLGASLTFGLYHLHVTDYFNCELQQSVTLNQYYNPVITDVSVTDVKCYGESNGSATILSTTGTKRVVKSYIKALGFVYNDTITDITQAFDTLKKSSYEIYAIDSLHCRSNSPYIISIDQPDTVLYLIVDTIIPVVDKGSSSGSIKSIVYGGNDGLKNLKLLNSLGTCIDTSFQRNEFPFFFSSLKAGNYTIRANDNKGCNFSTKALTIAEPDTALGFRVIAKHDALCKSQTGAITVQGFGGWGGYKYKRATYNAYYNRNSFDNLYAGNYLITVQDSRGATFGDTVVLYEPKDSLKSWILNPVAPTCVNNGGIQVAVFGGTAPYSILNQTTGHSLPAPQPQSVNFTNLSARSYLFNVTDSNGCHFDLEAELPDTNLLKIVQLEPVYPSGVGTSDGAIKATVKGGKLPYRYQWKQRFGSVFPETSPTLKNIPSGHYQLNVFEIGGCSITAYLYLPGINDIAFTIANVGNETSYNAHNGYCTLTSSFNSWQNFELITPSGNRALFNATDSTSLFYYKNNAVYLRNLNGGNYFISGVTSTGEKVYAEFRIEPYLHFYISDADIINVDTTGGSNGKITVVITGGGGNNRFTWQRITSSGNIVLPGENYPESSILNNIPAGNYRIVITDRYNNSIYDTLKVLEPDAPLSISVAEYKNESCKTYEDAYVVLQAAGGWGDYQFRDDNTTYFKNGNMFYNLDVRKHNFYLTDKTGTIRSISLNIVEPDYLTSSVAFVDSVNCKNKVDGNIGFNVKGGTAPYRFANSNVPALWTQDTVVRNISAGNHTYLFTDSNNCIGQDTLSVYMPEPDSLLFSKVNVIHTTCTNDNGVIKIKMRGGTRPYRYEWTDFNNILIGSDTLITGLSQNGYYKLNVLDWHNCPQHLEQRIKPSINPIINNIDTVPVICYGDSTGIAYIKHITPGTPYAPCNFTWSNKDTGKIADGYPQGIHFVTISDTNHCSTVKYFEITQPDSLWVTASDRKNAHCYGYKDGFLVADGRGGVGGYHYHWSTGDTTSLANNLYKGGYSISITDANGCNNEKLFTITEPNKLLVTIGDDIKMCPGNSYTLDGKAFATHQWSTNLGVISNERYITVKDENNYYLEVSDSIGCFAHDTINVSIGNDALRSDFLMSSQASNGDTLKLFELSNMPLDSLRWSFNDTVFSRVANTSGLDYLFLLKAQENGIYNIDLYAFSGGCVSKSTKQIEITGENKGPDQGDGLGFKDPLIISLVIAPNPNNGNFRADIKLREVADIDLVLFTVSSGLKIDERFSRGQSEYSIDYNFSQLNSGLYLLILKAKEERKQIKILIQY